MRYSTETVELYRQHRWAYEKRQKEAERARARNAIAKLPEVAARLREDFGATKVGVFGSLLNGRLSETSDVDLFVDQISHNYFSALDIVSEILGGVAVDLIVLSKASDSLRERIEKEGQLL